MKMKGCQRSKHRWLTPTSRSCGSAGGHGWRAMARNSILGILMTLLTAVAHGADGADSAISLAKAIEQLKQSPRGPFSRVRWFCKDGSVLKPAPYACRAHGGGIQHGQLNRTARQLRRQGYFLANVLADYTRPGAKHRVPSRRELTELLLERWLIEADDGWIFRHALNHRGMLQRDDEVRGATQLFDRLSRRIRGNDQDFLLLRETWRLLPQAGAADVLWEVRQRATRLAEQDSGFASLRARLHNAPSPADAERVFDYAVRRAPRDLERDYAALGRAVAQLFAPAPMNELLQRMAAGADDKALRDNLRKSAKLFETTTDPAVRLRESARLLAVLRNHWPRLHRAESRRQLLSLSLALEQQAFAAANALLDEHPASTRSAALARLRQLGWAVYGSGFWSRREWLALEASLDRLTAANKIPLSDYYHELRYLTRGSGWSQRWMLFHFGAAIEHWQAIEPKVGGFVPARLRGSVVLTFSRQLDRLLRDAGQQAKLQNKLFGETVGAGLWALNPGLADGTLYVSYSSDQALDPNGIYLLPETTARLSPVAGILTQGEGNALSHVQLLAANLGIPNVVIDAQLSERLKRHAGEKVTLAVSPGGLVELTQSKAPTVSRAPQPTDSPLTIDTAKLNLKRRDFPALSQLAACDAGRIAGPKAANLGELKRQYPEAVTDGLVIPFGHFRALLDRPLENGGPSVFEWMHEQYRKLAQLQGPARDRQRREFLARLRHWIEQADPGETFRRGLQAALQRTFGADGDYAVFVRSDTNVEDLPGFTGAGLNLTVANVVGFDNILKAILRVWASPFTDRAWRWRQARMAHPEAVYPSVLLLRSVAVDKSGVMITLDTRNGEPGKVTVATNHGVGGAVAGQAAETWVLSLDGHDKRLLADATAPRMRLLDTTGGLRERPVPASGKVLTHDERRQLLALASTLPARFPQYDGTGRETAADVEFGFRRGKLTLFQIRPYVRNRRARRMKRLVDMDTPLRAIADKQIDLAQFSVVAEQAIKPAKVPPP